MRKLKLLGKTINRLTVLEEDIIRKDVSPNHNQFCKCRCSCGREVEIERGKILKGSTKSCGCYNEEQNKKKGTAMNEAWTKYTPREATAHKVFMGRYNDGDLSFEEFLVLTQLVCEYCDKEPSNVANCFKGDKRSAQKSIETGDFVYSGIDRIDSSKPHDRNNCVPCCKSCNWAKSDQSHDEFLIWIKAVYTTMKNRQQSESEKDQ